MSLHSDLELLQKAAAYCAYRERTVAEVTDKLRTLGATDVQKEKIVAKLIVEKYIDESRFAASFVRGKFNVNKWGRLKIKAELNFKGIDKKQVEIALKEIDERDYQSTLKKLLEKKTKELKGEAPAKARAKLMRFAYSKGFEPEVINKVLSSLKA
jgi:regulatory protein